MRKKWSPKWNASRQPRKQRKFRHNAALHARQKLVSAHLSKELRKQVGRRSVPLRKGDEVTVVRGEHRKKSGKISKVELGSLKIYIEGLKVKKVSGQEVGFPVEPSNVIVTRLNLDDKQRVASLRKAKQAAGPAQEAGKK
jgi:large subunit ribosomal protein L24